jgi:IS4 transposase
VVVEEVEVFVIHSRLPEAVNLVTIADLVMSQVELKVEEEKVGEEKEEEDTVVAEVKTEEEVKWVQTHSTNNRCPPELLQVNQFHCRSTSSR